jgi:hypothetical protein
MPHDESFYMSSTIDTINYLLKQLQKYKSRHPERKIGFQNSYGGVLNAYREGDITFKQAVRHLNRMGKNLEAKAKK